jgi:non-canonical (house-cleaning) NTP pyrophosphatase
MKTKAEKLKLAAQLLDQDKSYRVIAKRTHLSLNDISALKKQKFGDEKSQTSITADNKYTEAYKLFKQKKYKLIDVAIELGLDERTTTKFWREYCKLENIDGLIRIYDNIGPGLSSFLELYKVMKEQELAPKDVEYVAKKLIDIQELERHEENLKNQIRGMQSQKMRLSFDLDGMQQRWGMLEKYCDERKDELELLQFQISKLRKEKQLHEDGSEAE